MESELEAGTSSQADMAPAAAAAAKPRTTTESSPVIKFDISLQNSAATSLREVDDAECRHYQPGDPVLIHVSEVKFC